jgi:hypothetical protein
VAVRIDLLEVLVIAAAFVVASIVVYILRRASRGAARGFDVAPLPPPDRGPRT